MDANDAQTGNHVFIVFEGLDGAGKTTLARMLAQDLEAKYIATPPSVLDPIRKMIDENVSLEMRFLYYLLGNVFVSEEIRGARKSRIVICDRYIDSTLAIHQLLGVEIRFELDTLGLEKPDVSLFLYTSDEDERQARIKKRGKRTKYDQLKEEADFRKRYIDYFRERGFIFVDTSHDVETVSLEKIKKEIEYELRRKKLHV